MSNLRVSALLVVDDQHRIGAAIGTGSYTPDLEIAGLGKLREELQKEVEAVCAAKLAQWRKRALEGVRDWTAKELKASP